jgi:hypothetical protein
MLTISLIPKSTKLPATANEAFLPALLSAVARLVASFLPWSLQAVILPSTSQVFQRALPLQQWASFLQWPYGLPVVGKIDKGAWANEIIYANFHKMNKTNWVKDIPVLDMFSEHEFPNWS